jgi:hypothetical protein
VTRASLQVLKRSGVEAQPICVPQMSLEASKKSEVETETQAVWW